MAGHYSLFQSEKSKEWYFNLKASNGQIILQSEGYKAKSGAQNGIASVRKNCVDGSRFASKQTASGHSFLLKAANGETIGRSEVYNSKAAMENGIASVMKNGPSEDVREA